MKRALLLFMTIVAMYSSHVYGQFSRNFLTSNSGLGILSVRIMDSPSANVKMTSLHRTADPAVCNFKISEINTIGDQTDVTEIPVNIPDAAGNTIYLSGSFETATHYLFAVIIRTGSTTESISYYKIDKSTLATTQSYVVNESFKIGYCETKMIGSQLVSYLVKANGGLYRLAVSTSNLILFSSELVDASVTLSGGASAMAQGKPVMEFAVLDGKEISTMTLISEVKIYTRNGQNNYISTALSSTNEGGTHLLELDGTTLLVCNAEQWFKVANTGQIAASGTFSTGANFALFLIARYENNYYRIARIPGGSNIIEVLDPDFNLVSSQTYTAANLGQFLTRNGYALFLGTTGDYLVDAGLQGEVLATPSQAYIHYIKGEISNFLPIEYHTRFKTDDLLFRFCESSKMVSGPQSEYHSGIMFNDSIRLGYLMQQIYNGITPDGDTVGQYSYAFSASSLVGPFTTPALYNEVVESKFNRGFYVTREMIEDHIDSVQSNSTTYIPPHGIREWPGNGDVSKGQSQQLADFVDANSNGIYEPMLGEYPVIYGERCFLQIWHDHPYLDRPGGLETHSYAYTLSCDTSDLYENTVFFKTKCFSRQYDLSQFSIGTYVDFDLGNPYDDYVGTHVELGMVYNYNGDFNDEPFGEMNSFGNHTPVQGFMVLKGNKKDNDGLDNPDDASPSNGCTNGVGFGDGIADNEYFTLERSFATTSTGVINDPSDIYEWMRLTNGFWTDGSPQFYGGSGNVNTSATTMYKSRFIFPGGSDALFYGTDGVNPGFPWTPIEPMGTGSTAIPTSDFRIFASHGTRTLNETAMVEFDYVYMLHSDTTIAQTEIGYLLPSFFDRAEKIKQAFNQNNGPCGTNFDPIEEDLSVNKPITFNIGMYPNPSSGIVRFTGINNKETVITIYDESGRKLKSAIISSDSESIDLSELNGNLFVVKIQQDQFFTTKKLIKN